MGRMFYHPNVSVAMELNVSRSAALGSLEVPCCLWEGFGMEAGGYFGAL